MHGLIDGDVLRYEIGFAAETGWKAITEEDAIPPWDYVEEMLHERLARLRAEASLDSYDIFLSSGPCFRFDIAKTKPYKGNRRDNKPFHFKNLTVYMRDVLGAKVITEIEADDAMAIEATANPGKTTILSRDKDLRQVTGRFYSWELGGQAAYGPITVSGEGTIELHESRRFKANGTSEIDNKLVGNGWAFFCSQLLTGDIVDNVPGLPKVGPKKAYEILEPHLGDVEGMFEAVRDAYEDRVEDWEDYLLEQGQLLWMVRRYENGKPQLWNMELRQ